VNINKEKKKIFQLICVLDNLDRTQTEALKSFWVTLTDTISKEASLPIDQIISSPQGDELFRSIGYDNPDAFILRWLRARTFDVNAAVQQLMDTLKWRCEWGVDALIAKGENELLLEEIMIGKSYFMGRDREGRPICYIYAKEHIKDQYPAESTEKMAIFLLETGRKLLEDSVETGTVVVDMTGFGRHNIDYPLIKFFIHLLANYCPESLGLALIIHPPLLFYSCWAIVKHWIDPVVESKIHILKHDDELTKYIDPSNLPKQLHGTHPDFEYIPPTDQDRAMLNVFRADTEGRKLARAAHRKAARHYIDLTLKWAYGDKSHTLLEQRKEATKQLQDAFEQFVPYVNTRTYYHRIGAINEPIFDIAYEKLRRKNELKIVKF
jgi:hypothetical protein